MLLGRPALRCGGYCRWRFVWVVPNRIAQRAHLSGLSPRWHDELMFWRLVTSRWAVLLGLALAVLGIPGTLQDAATWLSWFDGVPRAASLVAGSLLLVGYFVANRRRLLASTRQLLAATRAVCAAFRREFDPPIRTAVWADLDSGQQKAEADDETQQWEVIDHTIRRAGMVGGEAYPALVGMAQVKELHGQRHLYMCMFMHASGSHMELRIESHHDTVLRRHALLRVDGELLSDMTFEPCLTSTVSDLRRRKGIRQEAAHLLNVGGVLSVSVTDTVPAPSGEREYRHDLLRVPLRGYKATNDRLGGIASSVWSVSVHNYSPPEIGPTLDPTLLDRTMRSVTEPSSYRKWRKLMAERFGMEEDDSSSTD